MGSLSGLTCLVTGAAGFVGHRIVQMLLEEEPGMAELRVMDKDLGTELLRTCQGSQSGTVVRTLQGDIRDSELLQRCCQGADLVIHTAAIIDTVGNIGSDVIMSINVTGTEKLLEACVQNGVRYFIYTSSMEAVGPNARGDPVVNGTEDLPYDSRSGFIYGRSKRLAEKSVLRANGWRLQDGGGGGSLLTCALRPTYIYGEGSQFLQLHLDQAVLNGGVFRRISRKEALANPVYVGNVAWAHLVAARAMADPEKAEKMAGNVYYVADDTPHMSYSDLNHQLGRELGLGVAPRLAAPLPLLYLAAALMEALAFFLGPFVRFVPPFTRHLLTLLNTTFTLSYRKLAGHAGYRPRYSWDQARARTSAWMASVLPQRKEHLIKKK